MPVDWRSVTYTAHDGQSVMLMVEGGDDGPRLVPPSTIEFHDSHTDEPITFTREDSLIADTEPACTNSPGPHTMSP